MEAVERASTEWERLAERLALPTYQNRLRLIGREIDRQGLKDFVITEVNGGFLVCAAASAESNRHGLEFGSTAFPPLIAEMIEDIRSGEQPQRHLSHPALLPTGTEDFLRALGYVFDDRDSAAVVVVELHDHVAVGGMMVVDGQAGVGRVPFSQRLGHFDVASLIDSAIRRRTAPPPARDRSRLFSR